MLTTVDHDHRDHARAIACDQEGGRWYAYWWCARCGAVARVPEKRPLLKIRRGEWILPGTDDAARFGQ
jgi:hypothetical protein